MNIKKLLGKRIKELRKRKNLTQENAAEYIGIDTGSLSNIETGRYYPTAENLEKIAVLLDAAPEKLFAFEHLKAEKDLLTEINGMLKEHPERLQDIYKIIRGLLN